MKTYKIIFSPTGGTSRVADAITKNWHETEVIDLSSSNYNASLEADSLALIAMPSFGGLAPQLALDRLAKITANNAKCAIVAVYGNSAYDDTLIQMKDYAESAGFCVIAAISAVAEHSIIHAYAAGRPDVKDCDLLCSFGAQILEKATMEAGSISVPGNKPYKKAGSALVPKANSSCTTCGLCANNCPTKARSVNPVMTKIAALTIKKACSEVKQNELFI